MRQHVMGLWGVAFAVVAFATALVPAGAQSSAPMHVKWSTQAVVHMSLTPNYFTGFGQVKAAFGTQPAPTHGPNAGPAVGQGDVDFGNIIAGINYIYKYATHINVTTNDSNGFKLYGEGAAQFVNSTDSTSTNLNSTLFYVNSTSGSPADTNTGFSPGLPFQNTSGIVTGGSYNSAASINYGGSYPSQPVANSAIPSQDLYYDYLLKVPVTATPGLYFVWVVYTVVPN